jgi:hypothetical protein
MFIQPNKLVRKMNVKHFMYKLKDKIFMKLSEVINACNHTINGS